MINKGNGIAFVFLDKGQQVDKTEINFQRGQTHIYPFEASDPNGPKRNYLNYTKDLNNSISSKTPSNGVKGPCPLSKLKSCCNSV